MKMVRCFHILEEHLSLRFMRLRTEKQLVIIMNMKVMGDMVAVMVVAINE